MNFLELLLIAIGLSMDAFAVAVCIGLTMTKATVRKALVVGMYFGLFQAIMPLIGYLIGAQFADLINAFDHWVAFALLCFIGGKMIVESRKKEECADNKEASLKSAKMLPLALATSIDALAAGVSFAFLKVTVIPAVLYIGFITLALSMAGVKIGNTFGAKYKSKAEFTGGVILILMGLKILFEHTGVINL